MVKKLMFRLLPVQIILAAAGTINMIVSSFFASNCVGQNAMSAVGLYGPLNMFFSAVSLMLVGGSSILCGEYLGQNHQDKLRGVYTLDVIVSALLGLLFTAIILVLAVFDLTGFFTSDAAVRPLFNHYLIGQAIGILPFILSNQYASFLFVENRGRTTQIAVVVFILVNLGLNYLFVVRMGMEALGLSLASSIGMWVFLAIEAWYFVLGRSQLKFTPKSVDFSECASMIKIGLPGALSNGYQTIRGLIVNHLIEVYVGAVGLSAFAAANNFLALFWAIPTGMVAVSRMLMSVAIGEEDRRSLTEVMRIALTRYVPLMCIIATVPIIFAHPLAHLFFKDTSAPVYMMTVWAFRILPLCLPLGIPCMHYVCYAQAAAKQRIVYILTIFDGVINVALFTAILIPFVGMNSVYHANVINGVVCILIILIYATICRKRFPRSMDDLMVIPDSFGAGDGEHTSISVKSIDEAVNISQDIQKFCLDKGMDKRKSFYAALAAEEMVVNVVEHGFARDKKRHSVDVRVVCKEGNIILSIKDDCQPFDPESMNQLTSGDDVASNIGIRMIYSIAESIKYQNMFGLNVLTIRI